MSMFPRSVIAAARRRLVRSSTRPSYAGVHSTAQLYETARVQHQGRPATDIVVGAHSHIRGELLLFGHGGRIEIGKFCYVGEQTRIWSAAHISIGDRVLISHLCTLMDNLTHPLSAVARHRQFKTIVTSGHPRDLDLDEKPIRIEDDVLIGCSSIVMRGVTIGRGAIVGAGSVVTRDVAPFTVVAGNPARFLRQLAPEEFVEGEV